MNKNLRFARHFRGMTFGLAVIGIALAQNGLPSSDSFEGSSLDGAWQIIKPEVVDLKVADGQLTLKLKARALWAGSQQGVLIYKLVTGNFKVTATVQARSASDPSKPPPPPVNLGGLMARNPAGGQNAAPENYVHEVVGFAPTGIAVETKTTVNSVTQYEAPKWDSSDAELRICRLVAEFRLYKRMIGAKDWQLSAKFTRPDLPQTIQVGANIYSVAPTPDLSVTFKEIRFETAPNAESCEKD